MEIARVTWGWFGVSALLRTVAGTLESIADWLDGDAGSQRASATPLRGTRERIAATLDQARSRYEAVEPSGARKRSRRAPRR